jgi:hypothetical protein
MKTTGARLTHRFAAGNCAPALQRTARLTARGIAKVRAGDWESMKEFQAAALAEFV